MVGQLARCFGQTRPSRDAAQGKKRLFYGSFLAGIFRRWATAATAGIASKGAAMHNGGLRITGEIFLHGIAYECLPPACRSASPIDVGFSDGSQGKGIYTIDTLTRVGRRLCFHHPSRG